MISIVTPTGGRPEAFALCEKWMSRQTMKWDQWIVVDDGSPPTITSLGQTVLRPEPLWSPGENTQCRNLAAAIPFIDGDRILIIEDDDWYSARYIEIMNEALNHGLVAGELWTLYYHVSLRAWNRCANTDKSSLFQTGFRKDLLPIFTQVVKECPIDQYIDMQFWNEIRKRMVTFLAGFNLSVGIKGMPGRGGISRAHLGCGFNRDSDGLMLKSWLGADADEYLNRDYPNIEHCRTRYGAPAVRFLNRNIRALP